METIDSFFLSHQLAFLVGFLVFFLIGILFSAYSLTKEDNNSIRDWFNLILSIIGLMIISVSLADFLLKN